MHDRICTAAKINPNKVFRGETATTVYDVGIHALRHAYVKLLLKYFTTFFEFFAITRGIKRKCTS